MQVNLKKSFIVTTEATTNDISFHNTYLNRPVMILIKKPNESTRYFGIWISALYNKKFVKQQLENEITDFILKLNTKPITNKQLRYLCNQVLIPRLEYRFQLIV